MCSSDLFLLGPGAMLELEIATICQKFLLAQGFTETGNVDFVKRILLDGTGLDPKQFLKVREVSTKGTNSILTANVI